MSFHWNRIARFAFIGMCGSLVAWISTTNAREEASVLVNKPAATADDGPALPPPSNPQENAPVAKPNAKSNSAADPFVPSAKPQAATIAVPQKTVPNTTVKRPFMRPAVPRAPAQGKLTAADEPMPTPADGTPLPSPQPMPPAPGGSDIQIQPTPPIVYDTDHEARRMYRSGQVDVVMLAKDAVSGCYYQIPMCIPACCTGDPVVSGGRGILGRGVVEYRWSCGFRAIVRFRHVLGDVRVDYEGD